MIREIPEIMKIQYINLASTLSNKVVCRYKRSESANKKDTLERLALRANHLGNDNAIATFRISAPLTISMPSVSFNLGIFRKRRTVTCPNSI